MILSRWPAKFAPGLDHFTTVASWRGAFGQIDFGGTRYGLKVHEFRKFMDLPRRSGLRFELALDIHSADSKDQRALEACDWKITNPQSAAGTPKAFQVYLQRSGAEFSVAQGIYVQTQSAWFSDRTAHYLASGKPVLIQDTGFSPHIPTGEGLLAFNTLDEALAGATAIARDYFEHSRAARDIAERYLDSKKVLSFVAESTSVGLP